MTRHGIDAPEALTDGTWQPDGRGVMRWVAASPPAPALSIRLLVACPSCHAKVNQTCHTAGGNPTSPHLTRLAPRLCACGELLARKKQMCPPCALEARRETYRLREARRPTRARRKPRVRGRRRVAQMQRAGRCWAPLDGKDYRSLCGLPLDDCTEHDQAREAAA